SVTVSPIRDASGRIVGASKIARDITFRKQSEKEIADAEARRSDLHKRLLTLVAASGSLVGALRVQNVLPATLKLAAELVPADAYAVWRLDVLHGAWHVGAYEGVSKEFAS